MKVEEAEKQFEQYRNGYMDAIDGLLIRLDQNSAITVFRYPSRKGDDYNLVCGECGTRLRNKVQDLRFHFQEHGLKDKVILYIYHYFARLRWISNEPLGSDYSQLEDNLKMIIRYRKSIERMINKGLRPLNAIKDLEDIEKEQKGREVELYQNSELLSVRKLSLDDLKKLRVRTQKDKNDELMFISLIEKYYHVLLEKQKRG